MITAEHVNANAAGPPDPAAPGARNRGPREDYASANGFEPSGVFTSNTLSVSEIRQ